MQLINAELGYPLVEIRSEAYLISTICHYGNC